MKKLLFLSFITLIVSTVVHNIYASQKLNLAEIQKQLQQQKHSLQFNKSNKHKTYEIKNQILQNQDTIISHNNESQSQPIEINIHPTNLPKSQQPLQQEINLLKSKANKIQRTIEQDAQNMLELKHIIEDQQLILQNSGQHMPKMLSWSYSPDQKKLIATQKDLKKAGKSYDKNLKALEITVDALTDANDRLIKLQKNKINYNQSTKNFIDKGQYQILKTIDNLQLSPSTIAALKTPITNLFKLFEGPSITDLTPEEINLIKTNVTKTVTTNLDTLVKLLDSESNKLDKILTDIKQETEDIMTSTAKLSGQAAEGTVKLTGLIILGVLETIRQPIMFAMQKYNK